jgi:hypothetical protein
MDIETEYNYKILDDSESDISDDNGNENLFIKTSEILTNEESKLSLEFINSNNSLVSESSDSDEQKINKIIFNVSKI